MAGFFLLSLLLAAQDPAPPQYHDALAHLAANDTVGAIARLRDATRGAPRFGPAFLRLGSLLSVRASEVPSDFQERLEAERALRRAEQLLGEDPEVLLEHGLLLRKQGMRVDAKRLLDRAWRAAERQGQALAPTVRARLHDALGRIYETWWEDWQNLIEVPPTAQGALYCARTHEPLRGSAGVADGAVYCPEQWAALVERAVPLADLKGEERARMLWHFRLAFEADSAQVDAAVRLLGHVADDGDWREYDEVARRLVAVRPEDPRLHLFVALGLHERGRDAAADSAFRHAFALLAPEDRRVFADIAPLLPSSVRPGYVALDSAGRAETARIFFAATDPLFLSGADERRLEHYARLAWAELKFSAPESRLRGWDSDRGRLWVRYGAPWKWHQCCYGGSGRLIFWSYGPSGPVFVFAKRLTYRRTRLTDPSHQLDEALAARAPEFYRPRTLTTVYPLPLQLARFRGSGPEQTRVEIYALPPLDSLGAPRGTAVQAGVFVFDAGYRPMWAHRDTMPVPVTGPGVGLNYAFELLPGSYRYGVEARVDGPESQARPAARARDSLIVPGYPAGRLALSDVLLGDSLAALVPNPVRRAELAIIPSRTLAFAPGAPVHLYFEVYGLTPGADSLARYAVELAVGDSTRRSPVERLARGVAELFRGSSAEPRIRWERVVPVTDDRAIEFLTVELRTIEPGEYGVSLRVTDEVRGRTAETGRKFKILPTGSP